MLEKLKTPVASVALGIIFVGGLILLAGFLEGSL